ncbi:MAG: hypothetical protein ACK5HO_00265 [Pseudomonadota bacterium]|jgi:hypothetical protein
MIRFIALIAALSLGSVVAKAEPLDGASYIGICNPSFPCSRALRALDAAPVKAIGYLADAFGYKCECVRKFLQANGPKYVRVHFANGTCFPERGRVCSRFDVFRKRTLKATEREILQKNERTLARYRASVERTVKILAAADSQTQVRYSLCLECPLSNKARRVLLQEALKFVPQEQVVDSVLTQKCLKGLICEKHGESPKFLPGQRCIGDTDGVSFLGTDIRQFKAATSQCEARFYWAYGFNLLDPSYRGAFIAPYRRKEQPTGWELEALGTCLSGDC